MRKKQFLNKIKSKNNKDGSMTPSIIEELLNSTQIVEHSKQNIFLRALRKHFKVKSARQIIQDNFETILNSTNDVQLSELLLKLMENPETQDIIKEKFAMILDRFTIVKDEADIESGTSCIIERAKSKFLAGFRAVPDSERTLLANIDKIIEIGFKLRDIPALKGLSEDTDNKLEEKLRSSKQEVVKDIIGESRIKDTEFALEQYSDTISIMISELLESENVRMIDIKQMDGGSYSQVYQIGEKVFKIGKPRRTYQIPNHTRILQPLTRINLLNEEKAIGCIEISDRVDKLESEDVDEEKLYQFYKELRQDGVIWTDVKSDNIGKLRRPNVATLGEETMDVAPNSVGLTGEKRGKELGIGDWVILDTDYIFKQGDPNIKEVKKGHAREFEKRYQQEMQSKIAEEHRKADTQIGDAHSQKDEYGEK